MFGKIDLAHGAIMFTGLIASVTDLRTGKIYNLLTLPSALIGFAFSCYAYGFQGALQSFLAMIFALFLYGWMFSFRILGGGDVKLLVAFGAWSDPHQVFEIGVLGILLGGVFSIIYLLFKGKLINFIKKLYHFFLTLVIKELEIELPKVDKNLKMPLGVPISIAAVWVLYSHPLDLYLWIK